jgi:WD40 repeat protein
MASFRIRIFARQVVAACACLPVLFLNLASGQEKVFPIGEGVISVMAISPRSDMLAIDAFDFKASKRHIVLFDIKKEKTIGVYHNEGVLVVKGLAFSKDGKTIISFSGKELPDDELGALVRFWDIESGQQERDRTYLAKGYGITLTERYIVTRNWPGGDIVNVFDLHDRKQIAVLKDFPSVVQKGAISPDGRQLATFENEGPVKVFELPSAKRLHAFDLFPRRSSCEMVFLREGAILAVQHGGFALCDMKTGKTDLGLGFFPARAISPDGKMAATRGAFSEAGGKEHPDGIHILSSGKKKIIATFDVDRKWQLRQMQFTPDNHSLVAVGDRGIVRLWDVSKLQP